MANNNSDGTTRTSASMGVVFDGGSDSSDSDLMDGLDNGDIE